MKNIWMVTGGIFGFTGVALGAFGAHGLKDTLSPEMLEIYKTGIFYHLVHAVVIFAIGLYGNEKLFRAALFLSAGIVLFSFSLYVYSVTSLKAFAVITPFGGLSFLAGWLLIIIASVMLNKQP